MDKVLLIDKPAGWTSFDIVAKIRNSKSKQAGQKVKVGHAGTLDPFATGLLIVLVGNETKKQDEFMKQDKEYLATLKLGETSSTGDPEGETTKVTDKIPTDHDIKKALVKFTGKIEQTPPQHSAIKINGKRAYELARAGQKVKLKPRTIIIYSMVVLDYNYPELKIKVRCSSGTYIRTLAEDIGKELGTGAYLTGLRRTKIGNFKIEDSKTIQELLDL